MTSAQVVETSVNVISNSPSQAYTHPDDRTLPNDDMTAGFKPFTILFENDENELVATTVRVILLLRTPLWKEKTRFFKRIENMFPFNNYYFPLIESHVPKPPHFRIW